MKMYLQSTLTGTKVDIPNNVVEMFGEDGVKALLTGFKIGKVAGAGLGICATKAIWKSNMKTGWKLLGSAWILQTAAEHLKTFEAVRVSKLYAVPDEDEGKPEEESAEEESEMHDEDTTEEVDLNEDVLN